MIQSNPNDDFDELEKSIKTLVVIGIIALGLAGTFLYLLLSQILI